MKFEYVYDDMTLKILDESYALPVLDFLFRNRCDFDKYEPEKPDNFYTEEFISSILKAEMTAFLKGSHVRFFQIKKEEPEKILGTVSFSHIITGSFNSCDTGYKIDKDYRRQNLGYTMISHGIEIMTKEKGMHRIESYIHPDNIPSVMLAKKLGFIDEGIAHSYVKINGVFQDHLRFAYIHNS